MISILSRVGVSARRMQDAANAICAAAIDDAPARHVTGSPEAPWQIIDDRHQVLHVVRYILQMAHEVTLTGRSRQRMVRSRIVAIDDTPGGGFLLERKVDDPAHAALLEDGRVNLGGRFLDLPMVCTVDISATCEVQGRACYCVPLPNWILFSEMRDAWRVPPPQANALSLSCHQPGQTAMAARVVDISEGGIGLMLPAQASFSPREGATLAGTLRGDDGEVVALELRLVHVSRHYSGGYRIGATIDPETPRDKQCLYRLIVGHQRLFAELH